MGLILDVHVFIFCLRSLSSFKAVLCKRFFAGSSFCSFSGVMYKTKTPRKCMLTSTQFIVY